MKFQRWMSIAVSTLAAAWGLAVPLAQAQTLPAFDPAQRETNLSAGWSTWTKFTTPVFQGQYPATGDPSVRREGKQLLMTYSCYDPSIHRPETCQATSSDGLRWSYAPGGETWLLGRTLRAEPGTERDTHETPFLVKVRKKQFLYVSGYRDQGGSMNSFPANVWLTRPDNTGKFVFNPTTPVLRGTPGWYDSDAIFSPSVVEHNGTLYMVYAGHCWTNCSVAPGVYLLGATSTDGVNWTKTGTHLFDAAVMPSYFENWAAEAELVKGPDGRFYLFFTALKASVPHVIGLARSSSPFGPWEFRPDPIVRATPGSANDAEVVAPSVVIEDGKVKMWFSGFSTLPAIAIYYAEAPWPLKF